MNAIVRAIDAVPPRVARVFRSNSRPARVLRPLINRIVPEAATPVVVRSGPAAGLRLVIFPRTEKYYWSGTHEVEVQDAFVKTLKPGMVFWDVGAHIGFFSLLASRLVGSSGRVDAYEPMFANRKRLMQCIQLNSAANVTVHDSALAAEPSTRTLFANKSTTMWTLVAQLGQSSGLEVRCQTLDQQFDALGPPDFIKIDAEGAEVDVLRGGTRLLSESQPNLLVEFSNHEVLTEAMAFLPGYRFGKLTSRHWLLTPNHSQDSHLDQ